MVKKASILIVLFVCRFAFTSSAQYSWQYAPEETSAEFPGGKEANSGSPKFEPLAKKAVRDAVWEPAVQNGSAVVAYMKQVVTLSF